MSGTIVVISTQPFTQQFVSLQNPEPQTGYPKAYSPHGGHDRPGAGARARHGSGLGRRARGLGRRPPVPPPRRVA